MSVVIVVERVDVVSPISTEVIYSCCDVFRVHSNLITAFPNFDSNQHDVDAFWMIQLQ